MSGSVEPSAPIGAKPHEDSAGWIVWMSIMSGRQLAEITGDAIARREALSTEQRMWESARCSRYDESNMD
jgi:hypothetical protein